MYSGDDLELKFNATSICPQTSLASAIEQAALIPGGVARRHMPETKDIWVIGCMFMNIFTDTGGQSWLTATSVHKYPMHRSSILSLKTSCTIDFLDSRYRGDPHQALDALSSPIFLVNIVQ